jgi:hypothetical protein
MDGNHSSNNNVNVVSEEAPSHASSTTVDDVSRVNGTALDNSKTGSVLVLLDVSAKKESSGVPHNASDVIANSQADNVSVMNSNVHGFVDVIDMSVHNFLGYNCILHIVDPVNYHGFTIILHNNMEDEMKW